MSADDGRTYYDEAEAAQAAADLADALVCRICGLSLTLNDRDDPRWAGTSTNPRAFLAHGECWDAAPPRERWKWPTDA